MTDIKLNGKKWFYTDTVKDHFFNPRNLLSDEEEKEFMMEANGVGEVGSPACGDLMKFWIKVENNRIIKAKFRTFGCASAIASTSILTEIVTENGGMTIEQALKIKPSDIVDRLGGLPRIKLHCSVLGDQALTAAIKNYQEKHAKL